MVEDYERLCAGITVDIAFDWADCDGVLHLIHMRKGMLIGIPPAESLQAGVADSWVFLVLAESARE